MFPLARLIFDGPITDTDRLWIAAKSETVSKAFLGVVRQDLSCEFFQISTDTGELCPSPFVIVQSKGHFSTLQRGFWFVMDRVRQITLEKAMETTIAQTLDRCTEAVAQIIDKPALSEEALGQLATYDYIGAAISVLHEQGHGDFEIPAALPIEEYTTLVDACKMEPIVTEVLKALPGWRSNEISEHRETWRKAEMHLRTYRSTTDFTKIRQRALDSLPYLVDSTAAEEFIKFLNECSDASQDVLALLDSLDFDKIEQQSAPGQLLAFAGQAVGYLSTAAVLFFMNCFWV